MGLKIPNTTRHSTVLQMATCSQFELIHEVKHAFHPWQICEAFKITDFQETKSCWESTFLNILTTPPFLPAHDSDLLSSRSYCGLLCY